MTPLILVSYLIGDKGITIKGVGEYILNFNIGGIIKNPTAQICTYNNKKLQHFNPDRGWIPES